MRKISALLACFLLFTACSCATVRVQEASLDDVQTMMEPTVQIFVHIAVTAIVGGEEVPLDPIGWSGSGVVYDHKGGIINESHALVLTANHVLEVPKAGTEVPFPLGTLRVDAVLITVKSASGRACELVPVVLGANTDEDVAVGEAQCSLGTAEAPIAHKIPPMGAKVYVVGHPLGIGNTMVTEGFFSGWMDHYMVASAPIAPGNSGGPVYYNGEVIGLAVRGTNYPNMSVIAPLQHILERIMQARDAS